MEEQVIVGLSNEVLAKIDALAAKIGITVEQIWPWMIRQQYVEAIYYSVLAILGIIVSSIILITTIKYWEKIFANDCEVGCVVGNVLFIGFTFVLVIMAIVAIPNIFNPEYWALKDLIRMIR